MKLWLWIRRLHHTTLINTERISKAIRSKRKAAFWKSLGFRWCSDTNACCQARTSAMAALHFRVGIRYQQKARVCATESNELVWIRWAHHKYARFPWRPKKEQNDGNCTSFQFQTPVIHVLVRLRNANRPIWSCNYAPFDFACASCLNHRQRQSVFFIRSRSLNLEQRLLDRLWLGMHVRHVIQDTMCTCFRVWFALRNKGKLWTFFWAKP